MLLPNDRSRIEIALHAAAENAKRGLRFAETARALFVDGAKPEVVGEVSRLARAELDAAEIRLREAETALFVEHVHAGDEVIR